MLFPNGYYYGNTVIVCCCYKFPLVNKLEPFDLMAFSFFFLHQIHLISKRIVYGLYHVASKKSPILSKKKKTTLSETIFTFDSNVQITPS